MKDNLSFNPITCVYSLNKLDFDAIEALKSLDERFDTWKDSVDYRVAENHSKYCDLICYGETDEDGCFTQDTLAAQCCSCYENGNPRRWYTDGKWAKNDGLLDVMDATIILIVNEETVQLLKSPETWERGLASLCYPGQCCAETEGDVLCYKLPKNFLSQY